MAGTSDVASLGTAKTNIAEEPKETIVELLCTEGGEGTIVKAVFTGVMLSAGKLGVPVFTVDSMSYEVDSSPVSWEDDAGA